ncbi:MAG: ribosome maturation factor RimM [Acidobacteriota bacterium]
MSRELPAEILVAQIVRPHGVRGDVVAEVFSDNARRFAQGAELMLRQDGRSRSVQIETSRRHKERVILRLAGVSDRDSAEPLRGAQLYVPRQEVPPPPADEYYFFELVGCVCTDETLGVIGTVIEVHEDGGGLLLEVERTTDEGEERVLVPFVKAYVLEVDTEAGRMKTDLPKGLYESCASTS